MNEKAGKGGEVVSADVFKQRRQWAEDHKKRERAAAAHRAVGNTMVMKEKQHQETVQQQWQTAHDRAETALHEHEVFFRDAIKTARHLGEARIVLRSRDSTRSTQARTFSGSPFSKLFADCASDIEFAGVAEAIEHWIGAQISNLGQVWIEYDGHAATDIKSYDQKSAREDWEMAITWTASTTPDSPTN